MDKLDQKDSRNFLIPACSIAEEEGLVTVRLEMPGVPKEGLEVRVEGNSLTVSGRRRSKGYDGRFLLRERRDEPFRKHFTIDDSVDRDRIDAALADGMLTLRLQVKEAARPRRIEIR